MTIIAYTFERTDHCIACTKYRYDDHYFDWQGDDLDEHGIATLMVARDGNFAKAITDTDDDLDGLTCEDCGTPITAADPQPVDLRITNASDRYDGFGTRTVEETGYRDRNGNPYRLVSIPPAAMHGNWQVDRYGSGMYAAFTPEKWDEVKDIIAKKENAA